MVDTVEAYLDRLFDLLAGSGGRGRRVLLEAQAHLEEAVEREIASGETQQAAERTAIARFGSPEEIARAHVEAGALPLRVALGRLFAAAWLMTSVAGLAAGLMGVLSAVFARIGGANFITDDPLDVIYTAERCRELGVLNGGAALCRAASIAHHAEEAITRPLVVGGVGLALLVLFALARRVPSLHGVTQLPNAVMVSTAGAVSFGGVGLLALAYGLLSFAFGERAEVGAHLALGLAGVVAGLAFLPHAWRHLTLERA